MRVLIVGGGKVGQHLAGGLIASRHTVTLVDWDPQACEQARALGIEAVCGDACTPECLERAQIRRSDAVVAVTGVDENNLVAAFLARREYGVPRVIARVNDPANAWLFTPVRGIDVAVSQAHLISTILQEELSLGAMVTLASLRGGRFAVMEDRIPGGSALVGRTIRQVSLPPHTAIVAAVRAGQLLIPDRDFTFEEGDEVIAVAEIGEEPALATLISRPDAAPARPGGG
jgi:trk system potassium uptake protein TrkA